MNLSRVFFLAVTGLLLFSACTNLEQQRQKARIHSNLGFGHLQQGDSTSALRELLEAEKLDPKDPNSQHGLALAYNAKGRFQNGLEHLRKALELDPKFAQARNTLGATYLELGRWDDAIREFETILRDLLYPTPYFVENNLGLAYYKKKNYGQAIEHYRRAVTLKPDFGLAFYNLGLAYRDNQQPREAISAFRSATALAPGFLDGHYQLGLLFFAAGRNEEAVRAFKEVVTLAPESENARLAERYLEALKKSGH